MYTVYCIQHRSLLFKIRFLLNSAKICVFTIATATARVMHALGYCKQIYAYKIVYGNPKKYQIYAIPTNGVIERLDAQVMVFEDCAIATPKTIADNFCHANQHINRRANAELIHQRPKPLQSFGGRRLFRLVM